MKRPTPEQIAELPPPALALLLARLQAVEQERQAGRVPWMCDRPDCDGRPHPGRNGPHARANQRPPAADDWDTWLLLAGRGFGKSRTGAEWSWRMAKRYSRGALIGPTAADTRDILVEGESGILACAPASFRPVYEPSKRRVTYPNGAIQTLYSADEPDRLRGPQHHYGWFDELASWRRLRATWDMAQMGMRLGDHPRVCITTTPRPLPVIKELLKDPSTHVVRGSTYDNLHNLAPTFRRSVVAKYEGTTLGRQELDAEILDDMPGALVSRAQLEAARVQAAPEMSTLVVAVDPNGSGAGDEFGIIACGRGTDGDTYVLADASTQETGRAAARKAWALFDDLDAHVLVLETNFGKSWLTQVMTDAWKETHGDTTPPIKPVTAGTGKALRAQPTALRMEQGRVHMVGVLEELESQWCTWVPGETRDSPDRVDAMVHGEAFLRGKERQRGSIGDPSVLGMLR